MELFIFIHPNLSYPHMTYELSELEKGRIRILVSHNDRELASIYFEKAKNTFQNKPITMNAWGCVDAKVEGLYEMEGEIPTPKEIVKTCQDLIREKGY